MMVMFGNDIKDPADLWAIDLPVVLDYIRTSEMAEEQVKAIRSEQDKEKRKALKSRLPYFVSGRFDGRRHTEAFIESSLFVIDIDHVADIEATMDKLKDTQYVHFAFRSPSGDGIKVGVRLAYAIKTPHEYSLAYRDCSLKFSRYFRVETDKTYDCARACFYSWDDHLFFDKSSALWFPKTKEEKPRRYEHKPFIPDADKDFERCAALARTATVTDYKAWIECGMALKNHFGDKGFSLFQALSLGKGFKDTGEDLWVKWKSFKSDGPAKIGSFIFYAKNHGGRDEG